MNTCIKCGEIILPEKGCECAAKRASDSLQPERAAAEREYEIHALRTKLYNAACKYSRCVNDPKHMMDDVMRLSDELEAAAEAWAFR